VVDDLEEGSLFVSDLESDVESDLLSDVESDLLSDFESLPESEDDELSGFFPA